MINSDISIRSHKEDLLERCSFAEHIAELLLKQNDKECIVIGIYGEWGSGKSSLINLVEEQIERKTQKAFRENIDKAVNEWYENIGYPMVVFPFFNMPLEYEKLSLKSIICLDIKYKQNSLLNIINNKLQEIPNDRRAPIIFRFNPWNISTMDKLIYLYFQELSLSIEKEDKSKNARGLAKMLEVYSIFFRPFTYYTSSVLSSVSKELEILLKNASSSIKNEYNNTNVDLEKTKKDIDNHLKNLNREVIVIIDDIDRLTQMEVLQIFQLVKINANFANVIYILLFDRIIVEKALNNVSNGEGREYLEKIIQVSFVIPKINDGKLDELLQTELKKLLKPYLENDCDKHRFRNIYFSGYSEFFKSVRDIRRYTNNLSFDIPQIYKDVNILDFLIIEAFRMFLPEVYAFIAENKEFFVDNHNIFLEHEQELWKWRFNSIYEQIGKENERIAKALLAYLFPAKFNFFGEKHSKWVFNEVKYQKEKRICSQLFFDIYFISGVPKNILSESEFENIIEKLKAIENKIRIDENNELNIYNEGGLYRAQKALEIDDYTLNQIFNELRDRNYATQFLQKFRVRNFKFSKDFIKEFCVDLFDICDYNNKVTERINIDEIYMFIENQFRLMESSEKKVLLEDIIRSSRGIGTISSMISISLEYLNPNSFLTSLFSQDDSEYFKKMWSDKMEHYAVFGGLKGHEGSPYLLSTYKKWGNEVKAKKYFDELITTEDGFLNYLKKLKYEMSISSSGDKVSRHIQKIDYSNLEEFLSSDEIEKKISSLDKLITNDQNFIEFATYWWEKYKSSGNYFFEQ